MEKVVNRINLLIFILSLGIIGGLLIPNLLEGDWFSNERYVAWTFIIVIGSVNVVFWIIDFFSPSKKGEEEQPGKVYKS